MCVKAPSCLRARCARELGSRGTFWLPWAALITSTRRAKSKSHACGSHALAELAIRQASPRGAGASEHGRHAGDARERLQRLANVQQAHDCVARFTAKRAQRLASKPGSPRAVAAAGAPQQYQKVGSPRGSRAARWALAAPALPSEYKQKIHAAFQIKNTEAWRNADDFDDELEMRNELMNLRALAAELVKDDRRKSTVYVQPTEKSLAVKKMLHAAMATDPLFKRCRTPEKEEMLGAFKFVHFDAKHVIIQQGDRGDEFYVLESGTVEFHVESRGKVGACGMGRGFGELALMYNTPRSASCIAATECTAWTSTDRLSGYSGQARQETCISI